MRARVRRWLAKVCGLEADLMDAAAVARGVLKAMDKDRDPGPNDPFRGRPRVVMWRSELERIANFMVDDPGAQVHFNLGVTERVGDHRICLGDYPVNPGVCGQRYLTIDAPPGADLFDGVTHGRVVVTLRR